MYDRFNIKENSTEQRLIDFMISVPIVEQTVLAVLISLKIAQSRDVWYSHRRGDRYGSFNISVIISVKRARSREDILRTQCCCRGRDR